MPSSITHAFTNDHHRCDRLLAAAESSAREGDWDLMGTVSTQLIDGMKRHFAHEEESMFPALAQTFPVASSPIAVMCSEHAQMRQLFEDLEQSVATRDRPSYLGILETLHFLVQQHNYKEESILYPIADNALGLGAADFAERIADV